MSYDSDDIHINIERLRAAGFRIKTPLPSQYKEVIEGLAEEEVDLLISMKERLDTAESETPPDVGPYSEYFLHPPF